VPGRPAARAGLEQGDIISRALFGCWPFTSSTLPATACGPLPRSPCGVSRSGPCSCRRCRACDEPLESAGADNASSDVRCRVGAGRRGV